MVSIPKVVGESLSQPDGSLKVSGTAQFTADLHLESALSAACLRSPVPHARIASIDITHAAALPGVKCVLTGRDIPEGNWGRRIVDMPVLAVDRVRFIGERIAVVAAEDPDVAKEACSLIEVVYEELPAVYDELKAIKEDAPLVHAEVLPYTGYVEPPPTIRNVYSVSASSTGDTAEAFAVADAIVEHTFRTPSQHHAYLEPHATAVEVTDDGK